MGALIAFTIAVTFAAAQTADSSALLCSSEIVWRRVTNDGFAIAAASAVLILSVFWSLVSSASTDIISSATTIKIQAISSLVVTSARDWDLVCGCNCNRSLGSLLLYSASARGEAIRVIVARSDNCGSLALFLRTGPIELLNKRLVTVASVIFAINTLFLSTLACLAIASLKVSCADSSNAAMDTPNTSDAPCTSCTVCVEAEGLDDGCEDGCEDGFVDGCDEG